VPGKGVMVALASAAAAQQAGGVAVPASAVTHGDAGDLVFVQTAKGFRPVPVTVAGQIGDTAYLPAA
jgi:multidrug efflux pump subunit AcrA (membrane-fusion protein)